MLRRTDLLIHKEQYVHDNPRVWQSFVFWRVSKIDHNVQLIVYSLRVQHVKSWQEHASVMRDKGELMKFSIEILMKLGIAYDAPASLSNLFVKELPDRSSSSLPPHSSYVSDYMTSNVESMGG